jgi:hypothetical protein
METIDELQDCELIAEAPPPPIPFVRRGQRNTAGMLHAHQVLGIENSQTSQDSQPSQAFNDETKPSPYGCVESDYRALFLLLQCDIHEEIKLTNGLNA